MNIKKAVVAFAALSQETRLRIYRLLIEYGEDGCSSGFLSEELEVPNNTLSFHLSNMSKAKIVTSKRKGRSIIYKANIDYIEKLVGFLSDDCCAKSDKADDTCFSEKKLRKKEKKKLKKREKILADSFNLSDD
ncbi:MAG: metalloregulator ArsR/SmtB family transcription factor [Rickettsiales bacterium]